MDAGLLWEESGVSSAFPLKIIEFAFTQHMMDVLQVLGPPPWLDGDLGCLTLKDSCSIRVVAAETLMIVERRDIVHFERVMEFLSITHTLLPHLVTPIKHMKIMFGLKTLIIMWMLSDDKSIASITNKIDDFFPDTLPQYYRSGRRHTELMQRTQRDFRRFAKSLAGNPEIRKSYIKDVMEEQYGECYAKKLEERLLQYLKELDKALPQPTYIDQVLNQSQPQEGRDELLHQILTCDSAPPHTALKRLLRCAIAAHSDCDDPGIVCIGLENNMKFVLQDGSLKIRFKRVKPNDTVSTSVVTEVSPQMAENTGVLCSRHGKKMKSILLECSEELIDLNSKGPSIGESSPTSSHTPLLLSTSYSGTQTQGSSCSTHISLYPDFSNRDISGLSGLSHQTKLLCTLPVHNNCSVPLRQEHHVTVTSTFSTQASLSITPSLQINTPSTGSPVQPVASFFTSQNYMQVFDPTRQTLDEGVLLKSGSALKSNSSTPFETITSSSEPSVQSTLSSRSKSSPHLSPFRLNQILHVSTSSEEQIAFWQQSCLPSSSSPLTTCTSLAPVTTHPGQKLQERVDPDVFLNPRASLLPLDAFKTSLLSSSEPASASPFQVITQAPSQYDQEVFSLSLSSTSSTPSDLLSVTTQSATQTSDPAKQGEERSEILCHPRLSSETQSFLLLCKWLQPHVKLYRLSQHNINQTNMARRRTEQTFQDETCGLEYCSFDVNMLYTDSESDEQDSDDPDYSPPKRSKL